MFPVRALYRRPQHRQPRTAQRRLCRPTTIFVLPPDMQELERRLRCRGTEDEETIQRRLKRAEAEIANSVNYDEHVVNIEVDSCAESIYSIIQFKLQHGSDE
jgi:guanylate kinase